MMGRAGNLFSNVLFKADKSRLTQTKCFLSPSLRRRKRGGETVAREREDSLSLFVLAPFLTRARVSSVSRKWNDDRDSRDARAPFEQKISVDATDKSQLFYLKRKFSPLGLFEGKVGGKQRKERNYLEERTLCERKLRLCSFLSFFSLSLPRILFSLQINRYIHI